jgi:hypothetical protein
MELISRPFGIGLIVGLVAALGVALHAALRRRGLRRELATLREHLHRQMEITSAGQRTLTDDLSTLRSQNENLRISLATLQRKPGRAELRALDVQERALRLLRARAPGFAQAWEGALQEAERELEKTDRGLLPMIRRALRPASSRAPEPPASAPGAPPPGEDDDR